MRSSVIAIIVTSLLSVAAGVAIAGLPSDPPGRLVVSDLPTTTSTSTLESADDSIAPVKPPTVTAVTDTTSSPKSSTTATESVDTTSGEAPTDLTDDDVGTTTEPESDDGDLDTEPDDSDLGTTTEPESDDGDLDTEPDDAAEPDADPDTADDAMPVADLQVAAVNGGARAGVATQTADELDDLGYSNVSTVDTRNPTSTSLVYFQPGLELEAARLATDLGWSPTGLAPMSELPALDTARTFELVAVIGLDLAPPT